MLNCCASSWPAQVYGTVLQPLHCWDRGFEFCRRHGLLSVVFVCLFVGSELCDGLMTGSSANGCVCVCGVRVCVWVMCVWCWCVCVWCWCVCVVLVCVCGVGVCVCVVCVVLVCVVLVCVCVCVCVVLVCVCVVLVFV